MTNNEYITHLQNAWSEYDRVISDHPIPDNERTANAYRMRDYIGYLIECAVYDKKSEETEIARNEI